MFEGREKGRQKHEMLCFVSNNNDANNSIENNSLHVIDNLVNGSQATPRSATPETERDAKDIAANLRIYQCNSSLHDTNQVLREEKTSKARC
jgi:hypothetical protein